MIGEQIRMLRIQKGLSINELATLANVSKSYISYIERGIQKEPSPHILSKIAKVLNTTLEELVMNDSIEKNKIDYEWITLLEEGIQHGLKKEDLKLMIDFVKYKQKKAKEAP